MKIKAALVREKGQPFVIDEIDLDHALRIIYRASVPLGLLGFI